MSPKLINLTINGRAHHAALEPNTTLLHALRAHNKRLGLATLCISGGMGLSMLVERV